MYILGLVHSCPINRDYIHAHQNLTHIDLCEFVINEAQTKLSYGSVWTLGVHLGLSGYYLVLTKVKDMDQESILGLSA